MITNQYRVVEPGRPDFCVTEYGREELECECTAWRRSKLEVDQVGSPFPIAVCTHLLAVQRQSLDRGFLTDRVAVLWPYVGWTLRPGGFVQVVCVSSVALPGYWEIRVPSFIAPQAPVVEGTDPAFTRVGLAYHASAGRKELAQAVAPYYATFGLDAVCCECGRGLPAVAPPEGLLNPDFRLEAVLWGVWLSTHGDRCPDCDKSDLIPAI